jgi:hypothetical protein
MTGISKTALVNYESNERDPGSEYLNKILELFPDINPTWLLTGEGEMDSGKESVQRSGGGLPRLTATERLANKGSERTATGILAKGVEKQTQMIMEAIEVRDKRYEEIGYIVTTISDLHDDNISKLADVVEYMLNSQKQEMESEG